MKVHCEQLDHRFELPEHPARVVSLTSGTTEALFAMGCGPQVAGVSEYCSRYVPDLKCPVLGDYLQVDRERLAALGPDLILVTTGIQRGLGLKLAQAGQPVFALPLPNSIHGILENIQTAAALLNQMAAGRRLVHQMLQRISDLRKRTPPNPPSVYVELWFGKHLRTMGGRTFIHDIVEIAGGVPLFGESREAYIERPLEEVVQRRPEVFLGFSEPEFPVDFQERLKAFDAQQITRPALVESTVQRGRNIIHDGPSLLETAKWLQEQLSTPRRRSE